MPVTYSYDKENKIINTDAHGLVQVFEIEEYLLSIFDDDDIEFDSIEIFSMENAEDVVMKYSELNFFKESWNTYKHRIGTNIIIIAPTQLSYGLFRMLSSGVESNNSDADGVFKIVKSREEAMEHIRNIRR